MKILRHILCTLPVIIVVALATACGTSRKATSEATSVESRATSWTNVYMPVKVSVSSPMSLSLSGRATMVRDRCIYLSMRVIGMEVAAVYIDNDSARFVDKYHKYLVAEPLADFLGSEYKHLTLSDIQDIILGQGSLKPNDKVNITPSDYVPTPAGNVARKINLTAETPQGDVKGDITWTVDKATWDDPGRTVSFKTPTGYKRLTMSGLRNMLKSISL